MKACVLSAMTLATCAGLASAQTFTGSGFAIPDNNLTGASNTITVPASTSVNSLSLSIDLVHSYAGDLVAVLSHNDGTTTVSSDIFRRIGNNTLLGGGPALGSPFGESSEFNGTYRFGNEFSGNLWAAAGTVATGVTIPTGDYRASSQTAARGYLEVDLNAVFAGRSMAGDWTLKVMDFASADTGSVRSWSITLSETVVLVPTPTAGIGGLAMVGVLASRRRRA